ncbi:hypothetical protein SAMN05444280_108131 [Tangfeifania diversioriginum]|uniref:Uncharacterized protein n=1 Tax=Tangfeifania diversioriginum TaxID=1168035 RepID=A0A1M6FDU9_9BACT|nr:hypothetical protein [Tangfeifania diversioriginum]SHI95809.1 hypothetical protein SAMN05444280_108131 [Tangfeifania diversioriginum]
MNEEYKKELLGKLTNNELVSLMEQRGLVKFIIRDETGNAIAVVTKDNELTVFKPDKSEISNCRKSPLNLIFSKISDQ